MSEVHASAVTPKPLPPLWKSRLVLKALGLLKVPMIGWSRASLTEMTDERCVAAPAAPTGGRAQDA
jgi:hypothetical protein